MTKQKLMHKITENFCYIILAIAKIWNKNKDRIVIGIMGIAFFLLSTYILFLLNFGILWHLFKYPWFTWENVILSSVLAVPVTLYILKLCTYIPE